MQYDMFRANSSDMATPDLIAVQRLLREDEETQTEQAAAHRAEVEGYHSGEEEEDEDYEDGSDTEVEEGAEGDTYDDLVELGRRIGDVKAERWALKAEDVIASLPTCCFDPATATEDTVRCIFCQCDYEAGETLRLLPCCHNFHAGGWWSARGSRRCVMHVAVAEMCFYMGVISMLRVLIQSAWMSGLSSTTPAPFAKSAWWRRTRSPISPWSTKQ